MAEMNVISFVLPKSKKKKNKHVLVFFLTLATSKIN